MSDLQTLVQTLSDALAKEHIKTGRSIPETMFGAYKYPSGVKAALSKIENGGTLMNPEKLMRQARAAINKVNYDQSKFIVRFNGKWMYVHSKV